MPDDFEPKALSQIKDFLQAGHSLDAIRQVGWGKRIDHLEAKGYDLRTGQLALRPPEETPMPDPMLASDEGPQASAASSAPRTSDTKGGPFELLFKPIRAWWTWAGQRQTDRARNAALVLPPIAVFAAIVTLLAVIGAVTPDGDGRASTGDRASSYSVLEQSEVVFEGGYSEAEIKRVLDRTMNLYGLSITESNYDRTTNVLVALRREYGVREMDILDYMIRSHVPGINIAFHEAASIATAFLSIGADY